MKTRTRIIAAAVLVCSACGDRALVVGASDGAVPTDAGGKGDVGRPPDAAGIDAARPPSCDPQDARESGAACEVPLGFAWNGSDCEMVHCECLGTDCGALYGTYGACMSEHAGCLPPSECDALAPDACEARADCRIVWYGGGCMDTTTCAECADLSKCVCWERGMACVPADPPCGGRTERECTGECFWVAQTSQACFENCCIDETWGYCRGRVSPAGCLAQHVTGCPEPCASVVGAYWNGASCRPIVCCCEGPDCGATYATWQDCLEAHRACTLDACGATGGYCQQGDYVEPTCLTGYGKDRDVPSGTCGLGVCCAPCPDSDDSGVTYVSHDPDVCARIDFECGPESVAFDNECGCGCRLP